MGDTLEQQPQGDDDDAAQGQDQDALPREPSFRNELADLPPLRHREMLPYKVNSAQATGEPQLQEVGPDPDRPQLHPEHAKLFARWIASKNVALDIDDALREEIGQTCKREFDIDDTTRADWKDKYRKWMDFAMQVTQPKTYPWPGASNIMFPLIETAALQFNARAYPAIVMGRNVVKGSVQGDDGGVAAIGPDGQPIMQGGPPAPNPGMAQPGAGAPPGLNAGPLGGGAPPAQQAQPTPAWIIPPGAKQKRADKIGHHMSWQLLHEMRGWEEDTDRLLLVVPIVGCIFRKSYYDPVSRRNVSESVDALRLCVNMKARSFETAPRYTEEIDFYPWEIESQIRAGLWLDYGNGAEDYGRNEDGEAHQDEQSPVTFCEQHRRYDLDGDGYDEPVIITFAKNSGKLARIVPGFDAEGIEAADDGDVQQIEPTSYYTKFGFVPNPDGGPYDLGFGHLLLPLNDAINGTMNQLFDAGHQQIAGGGFIGSGLSMNTGAVRFVMGEYKIVNSTGRDIKDNVVPIPFPGPNVVLMELLKFLVEAARDVASIKDILTGDMPGANVPAILGLAVIQQGLKVFSAVFKRIHRSLGHEFNLLFRLNRKYLPDTAGYRIGAEYFRINRSDYAHGAGVEPVSDPDMVTDAQQMAQANFLLSFKDDPYFDGREIRLRACQAANVPQIDRLLKGSPPPNAEIAAKMAELDIEDRLVKLRGKELDIRAAHQEADQDIRRGKDKATEIELLTRAIKNLADAHKSDSEVNQNWYLAQLDLLRMKVEAINASSEAEPPSSSPATSAGLGGNPAALLGGAPPTGVPGVAPPSGNQGVPGLSPGLPRLPV